MLCNAPLPKRLCTSNCACKCDWALSIVETVTLLVPTLNRRVTTKSCNPLTNSSLRMDYPKDCARSLFIFSACFAFCWRSRSLANASFCLAMPCCMALTLACSGDSGFTSDVSSAIFISIFSEDQHELSRATSN
jgi:hypothetical protein